MVLSLSASGIFNYHRYKIVFLSMLCKANSFLSNPEGLPATRTIRSYVLRQNRMTLAQKLALESEWSKRGLLITDSRIDPYKIFGRQAPLVLEIGFGNGESLLQQAITNPDANYLGIEVFKPGIGRLLHQATGLDLPNLKIFHADAIDVLNFSIPNSCVNRLQIYFPDPWPKKSHHKRRIIRSDNIDSLVRVLEPGGLFHIATDWSPYALNIVTLLDNCQNLIRNQPNRFIQRPQWRPRTKFECRGLRLKHRIFDILYRCL